MPKVRLDKLMVDRGLCPSRERARALIVEGSVQVAGLPASKPSMQVDAGAHVTLTEEDHGYVSRGAFKLIKALEAFPVDPAGMTCLDIGASTGGFTDVLLRRDAARVYAIDVGYGQLAWSIRQDERVVVLERENVRYLEADKVPEPCDLAVIDVSFISLTLILDKVSALLGAPGGKDILALIKPQFEVGKERVGKGGVVRNPEHRLESVESIRSWATARGYLASEAVESPIQGPAGNVEFLVHLTTPRD